MLCSYLSMTLEKARQLIWQAERVNLTVLAIYAQPNRNRDYLLVIETAQGDKLIFADSMKAHIALTELSGKDFRENLRYFALGEDGIPRQCDAEGWAMDSPRRKAIEISCSPQVTAVIHFVGLASPDTSEKALKLWAVNLNLATEIGSYGTDLFSSFEEANAFVNKYKANGSPVGSVLLRWKRRAVH
jgi:predicted small integral membrane protein